jgi:two-component system, OmpR family, phosphate regulon sensor histidine kinase PhoR
MKAGRIASLILLVVLVSVALLIGVLAEWLSTRGMDSRTSSMMIAGSLGLVFAVILLPSGWIVDRALARLERTIESMGAAAEGNPPNGGDETKVVVYAAPRWLLPITHAFTSAVDRFNQRERSLKNQLHEMEIRHRVSEAERRQVEAVLHALRDPVIVTDAFNEIVMVNNAAAVAFGFDVADVIHRPVEAAIGDARLAKLINDAKESANFTDCRVIEYELRCTDDPAGTISASSHTQGGTMYEVTLSCIENHKHEVGGVVTILRDLTRERELSQMKTDFVSKASHELRTPLSSIRAYVEMLVDGEATDEQSRAQFYRIIQDESERLARLIDNMLNISRIEAGIVQIEREQVDMKELVDRAIHTLEPHALERGLTLTAKLAAIDLCVEGDSDMLYQVVLNLVSNAVKYTPEGGRVTVTGDTDNLTRSVVITVADTGLGIPPDSIARLFDKFYRVENYKRIAKGTGLGLSLCKHIVEMVHRGQIGVESKLGMGSRFWFSVPMKYAGSQAA